MEEEEKSPRLIGQNKPALLDPMRQSEPAFLKTGLSNHLQNKEPGAEIND